MRLTGDLSPRSPQSYAMTGSDPLAVPAAVRGVDFPFTPHELLGIPADTTTGPNIYLYVVGLGNNLGIRSASLTGPSGPVPIGTVTQRTPGGEAFFYGGGVLIPTKPLTPGASYRADVVWLSPSGRTFNQTFAIRTAGGPPVLGSQLLAKVVSGKVRVKVPGKGQKFVLLRGSSLIPVGSLLDTRRGTVLLTSATGNGSQAGQFSGSVFQVLQSSNPAAKGLTELRLKGGSFRRCGQGKAKRATAARRPRTIRKLRGNAHGSFRTRGRRAAATIRGTRWTVADRCDGTLTTVARGVVDVLDFRRKRTVTLKAGQRYLARART
jgi:hypothetical protein